jgi:arsenate reductase
MKEPSLVLFVCLHASAKSLIAAEYFNTLATERRLPFRAISAGTEPDRAVPPHVVAGMKKDGFDVSRRIPERLTRELAAPARIAITFEPELKPYVDPTCRVERWAVPAVSDNYDIARDAIRGRVDRLVAGLGDN